MFWQSMMSILGGRVIVLPRARCWHLPATHLIVCQVILSIVNENIGTTAIQLQHSLFPTSMRMRGCSACIDPRKMLAMHLHYCGCVGYFMPFCAYFFWTIYVWLARVASALVKPCCSWLQCTQQHMVQLFPMKTCLSPHHSSNNSVADCWLLQY